MFKRVCIGIALSGFAIPVAAAPLPKPPSFAMCGVCHKVDKGARSTMGPNLWGVGNRKAGTSAGYSFSPAMKKYGQPWTRDRLVAFLSAPARTVPGNKMAYAGQRDPKAAAALADYLMSLK